MTGYHVTTYAVHFDQAFNSPSMVTMYSRNTLEQCIININLVHTSWWWWYVTCSLAPPVYNVELPPPPAHRSTHAFLFTVSGYQDIHVSLC